MLPDWFCECLAENGYAYTFVEDGQIWAFPIDGQTPVRVTAILTEALMTHMFDRWLQSGGAEGLLRAAIERNPELLTVQSSED